VSLIERIDNDLKEALKAGNKEKVTVLRGLKSDIKYKQIDKGEALTDEEVTGVMSTSVKKVRDSIEQFTTAGRSDLVEKETLELGILMAYLPQQLGEEELRAIIAEAITESGADSPQKVGLVMKIVAPKVKGRADGKLVSKLANEMLAN
jgi:uncharacterized protein